LGYLIEMKDATNLAATWSTVYDGSTHPDVHNFTFQNAAIITAGQTYSFRSQSRNIKGASPASTSIDIMAATIPEKMAAPTRVSVVINSSTLATTVAIQWTALSAAQSGGSPVTGYSIRRNNGYNTSISTTPAASISDPAVLTRTFTSELLIGVTYKIVIAALNAVHVSNQFVADNSGTLLYSDELQITVANVPAQVTGLHQPTTNYVAGKIWLKWVAPSTFQTVGSAISKYTIFRDVGSGVFYALAEVPGTMLEFTDSNLVAGQLYNYKVSASNEIGSGLESVVFTGTAG